MKVGYVVLYVDDASVCRRFWVERIGMVEKSITEAAGYEVARVGFAGQPFAFELVPLALMADNPDGLDLATPSVYFEVDDLGTTRAALEAEDPGAAVAPYLLSAGTDAKAFSRLGVHGYGFSPLRLPPDLDFTALFHGVDERVPIDAVTFGVRALDRFLRLA